MSVCSIVAGVLFLVCVITDFLDGYFSRKWNVVSNFGKAFDPVADKVLIVGTIIVLLVFNRLFLPLGILLVSRDILMDILRVSLYRRNIVVPAIVSAKWKTATQMVGLLILILLFSGYEVSKYDLNFLMSHLFLFVSSFFSIYSFFWYLKSICQQTTP